MRLTEQAGHGLAALLCAGLLMGAEIADARPLAASDWLSGGQPPPPPVTAWRPGDPTPLDAGRRAPRKPADLPESVARDVSVPVVGVSRLDGPDADRSGTVTAETADVPREAWAGATTDSVVRALGEARPRLPATRRLLRRMLVAQLDPPQRSGDDDAGQLFLARVDRLLALGALDSATQLLDAAGPGDRARFRRRFDAALLTGDESRACDMMAADPGLAPDLASRIFCLARQGEWSTAALALRGAEAMDLLTPAMAARLGAFLDDGGIDDGTEVEGLGTATPLDFRLMTAIGQPLPTADLPPAFAWADLGPEGGWKARLDAAERLARLGALPASRLRAIYLEERPAASGGVWERTSAVQALDAALKARDAAASAAALPRAVESMGRAGLIGPLSDMVTAELLPLRLTGKAGQMALWLALYNADVLGPKVFAAVPQPDDPGDAWLLAVARHDPPPPGGAPQDALGRALAPVLADLPDQASPPPTDSAPTAPGLLMLGAMADADAGLDGDTERAAAGVAALRALGREDVARAAALQLLLGVRLGAGRP